MEIHKEIFQKYIEEAAIEQLTKEYAQKGYSVSELMTDNIRADLVVKKDDEIIVFEIKTRNWTNRERKQVQTIRNKAIHEFRAKFKLVFVKLPEETDIYIEDLEIPFASLLEESFHDKFDRLATHYSIEEITDFRFELLHIKLDGYEIKGSGSVSLGLQYGSDLDLRAGNGLEWSESLPFYFHVSLNKSFEITEIHNLNIDIPQDI